MSKSQRVLNSTDYSTIRRDVRKTLMQIREASDTVENSNYVPVDSSSIVVHEVREDNSCDFSHEYSTSADNSSFDDCGEYSDSETSEPRVDTVSGSKNSSSLQVDIAEWSIQHNITSTSLNNLLKILREHGHHDLPEDYRTLLHAKYSHHIVQISGGEYCYVGLCNGVTSRLTSDPDSARYKEFSLRINVDGLPLTHSSNSQFWPILCIVNEIRCCEPFVVALYHGKTKPGNVNEYLYPLVNEMKNMISNGLLVGNENYQLNVTKCMFVCDAPARAFVKCIKSHNSQFGWEKCCVEGEFDGRMVFLQCDAPLRTDESFRNQLQEEHHQGLSPLCDLPFGMVSQFPLDYMHLVLLGVVRRWFRMWLKRPLTVRLRGREVVELSECLESLAPWISTEFARYSRSVRMFDRWKATELRLVLLYIGPVVLRRILKRDQYNHFMLLSISIYTLVQANVDLDMCAYAEKLIKLFVENCITLYGTSMLVYNVHSLLHLADDYRKYGSLDSFSAFPFESYLYSLKKLVRAPHHPLQQVLRRLEERRILNSNTLPTTGTCLLEPHSEGPIPPSFSSANIKQYRKVVYKSKVFYTSVIKDSVFILANKDIVISSNFIEKNSELIAVGRKFVECKDFFQYPCNSSHLGVFEVQLLSSENVFNMSGSRKCMILPLKVSNNHDMHTERFVCIPLAH